MVEKLKPCPYCGGIPAIYGITTKDHRLAWCLRLGNGEQEDYATQEAAHISWNKRVSNEEMKSDE